MPSIEVAGLTKRFGGVTAVDELSFVVESGAVTGFLGPNGSGKSTTMRAILGLVTPTDGEALIEGAPYHDLTAPLETVGAALETTGFHPGRSGGNHIDWMLVAAGLPRERGPELLGRVGLGDAIKRRVGGYSLGMKQRLALACALIGDPHILVLDEPANGLDPEGMRWLRGFLVDLARDGKTVFVSSHVLSEMELMADTVVIIDAGILVRETRLSALAAEQPTMVSVRTPSAGQLATALENAGAAVEITSERLTVRELTQERIGEIAAENQIVLHELSRVDQSLESSFLDLTKKDSS